MKMMIDVNIYLGKSITVGGKRKYDLFLSKVGSDRDFIQAKGKEIQLLIDIFPTHTEVLKNGYKSNS